MTSKVEQERRKALAREEAQRHRAEALASMPISQRDLSDLFNHLDLALVSGCDHSLRFTQQFLQARNLPEAGILCWLGEQGGYCDCEVLGNVEQEWEQ